MMICPVCRGGGRYIGSKGCDYCKGRGRVAFLRAFIDSRRPIDWRRVILYAAAFAVGWLLVQTIIHLGTR